MSKGYIDKEKVLSELCSVCKGIAYCRVPCALYNYIDNSSPADVKPVVRGDVKSINSIMTNPLNAYLKYPKTQLLKKEG